jgi:hypothetical protein
MCPNGHKPMYDERRAELINKDGNYGDYLSG